MDVDLIAIPDFSAGAMENWGLITYRLTSLLSNARDSSTSNQQWVITVVAHELAHQVISKKIHGLYNGLQGQICVWIPLPPPKRVMPWQMPLLVSTSNALQIQKKLFFLKKNSSGLVTL